MSYSIKLYKEYFNFAAAHFMLFEDGTREPLHGHNYRIALQGEAEQLKNDMVFDFIHIKPLIREICQKLDHRLILPQENPELKVSESGDNYRIDLPDKTSFTFPKADVILLPILNTSAERFAAYFASEIQKVLKEKHQFQFSRLEVEVEESPGQSAIFITKGGA